MGYLRRRLNHTHTTCLNTSTSGTLTLQALYLRGVENVKGRRRFGGGEIN